ncbi:hypothetical protein VN97_g5799 [Penicillium thymicola]|uniref:Uncharacterized protein n=1 Tax=Penicillium thymicola TaxID=293382 RepID=A0AAI9THX5_PENTH|nr:hypothetical protein VN97_g5799 [Penicillium thymicola]
MIFPSPKVAQIILNPIPRWDTSWNVFLFSETHRHQSRIQSWPIGPLHLGLQRYTNKSVCSVTDDPVWVLCSPNMVVLGRIGR